VADCAIKPASGRRLDHYVVSHGNNLVAICLRPAGDIGDHGTGDGSPFLVPTVIPEAERTATADDDFMAMWKERLRVGLIGCSGAHVSWVSRLWRQCNASVGFQNPAGLWLLTPQGFFRALVQGASRSFYDSALSARAEL